jgi:hypothetical protein
MFKISESQTFPQHFYIFFMLQNTYVSHDYFFSTLTVFTDSLDMLLRLLVNQFLPNKYATNYCKSVSKLKPIKTAPLNTAKLPQITDSYKITSVQINIRYGRRGRHQRYAHILLLRDLRGSRMCCRGILLQYYTASQPKRPQLHSS